jgi:DNA invertase Pin-like site-specific DNA recombinase
LNELDASLIWFGPITRGMLTLYAGASRNHNLIDTDIVEVLKARGVAQLSLEEKIDTSSAAGELILHAFGAIPHFERRLIAERTKDGIAAARARGSLPGRQPLDADKTQAALKLVEAGLSTIKAVSQLGLGRSTDYREIAVAGVTRKVS